MEWARIIGETNSEGISDMSLTNDGGLVAIGSFSSDVIDLGNGIRLQNKGSSDAMIIKYSSIGETEWAHSIGGTSGEYFTSVTTCSDGSYVVGGNFYGKNLDVTDSIKFENISQSGFSDAMLIRYSAAG